MMDRLNASVGIAVIIGMLGAQSGQALVTYEGLKADDELSAKLTAIPTSQEALDEVRNWLGGRKVKLAKIGFVPDDEYKDPDFMSTAWSYARPVACGVGGLAVAALAPWLIFSCTRLTLDLALPLVLSSQSGGILAAAANTAAIERAANIAYFAEDAVQWLSYPLLYGTWSTPEGPSVKDVKAAATTDEVGATEGEKKGIPLRIIETKLPQTPQELLAYLQKRQLDDERAKAQAQAEALDYSWSGYLKWGGWNAGKFAFMAAQPMGFQWVVSNLGIDRILYGLVAGPIANFVERREAASMALSMASIAKWLPGSDKLAGWVSGMSARSELLRGVRETIVGIDHLAGAAYNTAAGVASTIGGWFGWGSSKDS